MNRIAIGLVVLVVVMITIPLLLAWSGSKQRRRLGRTGGAVVLRMPRGHHAILAIIAILPFGAIAVMSLAARWAPGSGSGRWVLGGLMALIGATAGGYLLALEARGRIRVDDFSIEKLGAFTRKRATWHDVAKLTYNPMNRWFFLTLTSGGRLYVVEGMNGIADFAELALQRLPPAVLAACPDAVEVLKDLAAG
jgi:hypothetical protein